MIQEYANEAEGQADFFKEFKIPATAIVLHTDGVHNGNLLEFKTSIADVNQVLFQAIKYLSRLRINGHNVPANILLVDLNALTVYKFDSNDYVEELHQPYTTAASRDNKGFRAKGKPVVIKDYLDTGAQAIVDLLKEECFIPIRITEDCVVAWAERFYREVRGSDKAAFLNNDPAKGPLGELKDPRQFKGLIHPYPGDSYAEFSYILDRLNDKLKKIELGAFYTPEPYVKKSHELLREAIRRVPAGNDYVIIDRCAGTGNLQRFLTEDELSHVIVNTYEEFEYLELAREFGQQVRAVIPPTFKAGDPKRGFLLNGDALSDRFVLGGLNKQGVRVPNVIQQYLDNPECTIILFENPPYADVAGMESQKFAGRESFGWKDSWVRKRMEAEWGKSTKNANNRALRELTNLFIWSGFRYYLRQPTDSYVLFSPTKYFKSQGLVNKTFVRGFLFNRRHFHARKDAGVSVILWSNEDPKRRRNSYPLAPFDINRKTGALVKGAAHKENPGPGNIVVRTTHKLLSSLYDTRSLPTDEPGIVCEPNGVETSRKRYAKSALWGPDIIGYLVADAAGFENTDLRTVLTRVSVFSATNGFPLRSDNYQTKLPLFVVGRYPSEGRFWIRGVVNRSADNGDNFSSDPDFLKSCLIYTCLAYHNKCRSFLGSDGRDYRNELCFDGDTVAQKDLDNYSLTAVEETLLKQWAKVLDAAKQTANYTPTRSYGPFQIAADLNTSKRVVVGGKPTTVYDYPILNGELKTLKALVARYHADVIAPKLWHYGLLK
ncbi:hypothetical protein GON03_19465 [Nocardioides sp. MAH-18]|uniref:Uncharacterized protein n=1 Tax=Nocardioides agri TaxID=2682843 RepID=A0A6L6Y1D6_9ACTN|nr:MULTISPECIES: hypothetical protein [unclassified Nocardioides]MBA2952199.1 hypothetical protein [Nocardioides sp. CGMCC 1.13656]MVQ51365.1 hypothetical protein [Nocardioides sp. MAH-18]